MNHEDFQVSRRRLIKSAAVAATGVAVSGALAQDAKPNPQVNAESEDLIGTLKAKFNDQESKYLRVAVDGVNQASISRLKHPIPENSEPSFAFRVTPLTGQSGKGGAK